MASIPRVPFSCHRLHISLKLIRGKIDQVEEKVQVEWVQPRVLSRPQISALADRLTAWIDRLGKVDGICLIHSLSKSY